MRKILSTIVVTSLMMTSFAYAADPVSPAVNLNNVSVDGVTVGSVSVDPNNVTVTDVTIGSASAGEDALPTMNAAAGVSASAGAAVGEYRAVACSSNPLFGSNSCNQCYDGGSIKSGESLTGLFDNWTNNTPNILTAYKEEQKTPNMVKVGNTTWTATPTDETKMWKYSSDIVWTQSGTGGKSQYILTGGSKVRFIEADLGAKYTLQSTDKKNGDTVGVLRFPIVSHVVDAGGNDGAADTHYECVAYKLSAVAPAPTPTGTGSPAPAQMTQTETGPETLILIIAAFFIAFGLMFSLRRRM